MDAQDLRPVNPPPAPSWLDALRGYFKNVRITPWERPIEGPPATRLGGPDAEIWSAEDLAAKRARDVADMPILERPIPGANPEAQTLGAAMEGAMLGGVGPVSARAMEPAFVREAPSLRGGPPASTRRAPMQPITSAEVARVLEKWKEFGPQPEPTSAPNPSSGRADLMIEMAKKFAQERPVEPAKTQPAIDLTSEAALAEFLKGQSPVVEKSTERTVPNASAGGNGSVEEFSRAAGMAAQGRKFVVRDRGGNYRPSYVDGYLTLRPGETFGVLGPNGFEPQ